MTQLISKPEWAEVLVDGNGRASLLFQLYLDDIEIGVNAIVVGNGFNLPTSDPGVENALWNDGGTVKVSAG